MVRKFDFKRDIFYEALANLREYPVVFLYGARNTGKTICLKQLAGELPEAEYYNIKCMQNLAAYRLRDKIKKCITSNEPRTFLIDNPGYCSQCDGVIYEIAYAFDELDEDTRPETRIVFAGGSPRALRYWATKYFGDMAEHIVSDFPSYSEWLKFYGTSDDSENRERFMFEKSGLTSFVDFDGFLMGSLAETEAINSNALNYIIGNDCELLDEHILKDILFAILARGLGEELADLKANAVVSRHLNAFSYLAPDTLKQGCVFLCWWGLIDSFDPASARVRPPFICAELLRNAFGEHIPPEIKRAAINLYF